MFNVQRVALLLAGLQTAQPAALSVALDDRLHQPYRLKLFPWMPDGRDGGSDGRRARLRAERRAGPRCSPSSTATARPSAERWRSGKPRRHSGQGPGAGCRRRGRARARSPRSPDHFRLSPRHDHPRRLGRAGRGQRPLLLVLGIPGPTHRGIPLVTRADRGRPVGVDDHPGPAGAGRGNSRRPVRAAPRDPHGHGAPVRRVGPRVDDSARPWEFYLYTGAARRRRTRGRRPGTDGRAALALVLGAPRDARSASPSRAWDSACFVMGPLAQWLIASDGLARRERRPWAWAPSASSSPIVWIGARDPAPDRRAGASARASAAGAGADPARLASGRCSAPWRRAPSGRSGSPTCARRWRCSP